MKINLVVEIAPEDGPADEFVVQNLKDVGFDVEVDANGGTRMSFDGEISANDLAYGASMFKSMKGR